MLAASVLLATGCAISPIELIVAPSAPPRPTETQRRRPWRSRRCAAPRSVWWEWDATGQAWLRSQGGTPDLEASSLLRLAPGNTWVELVPIEGAATFAA